MSAGPDITARVIGVSEVKARFAAIRDAVPDLISSANLGPPLVESMKARFRARMSPDGSRWASYISGSQKGRTATLRQSGDLYESLGIVDRGQRLGGSATGLGFRIGIRDRPHTDGSRITSTVKYGRLHQQGLGVTRRRFIGLSAADIQMITNQIRQQLKVKIAGR